MRIVRGKFCEGPTFAKRQDALKKKVQEIMELGMSGKISFRESLERRFKVAQILQKHIDLYNNKILSKHIDFEFKKIVKIIKDNDGKVSIVSGGFMDSINIIVRELEINRRNCFANEFIKDGKKVIGFNKNNLLSRSDDKIKIAKKIKEKYDNKKIVCIGDGHSDYLIREEGIADEFWGFWGNVQRKNLIQKADRNFYSNKALSEFVRKY